MQFHSLFNNSAKPYSFQGTEKDDEVKGLGKSYNTAFRQYDPRIGRWLSLDPMMAQFPDQSPFVAFNNNPNYFSDPNGLKGEPKTHEVQQGETLSALSNKYGVSQQAIIDANNSEGGQWSKKDRSKNWVYTGEKLIIPNYNVTSEVMKNDEVKIDDGTIVIADFYFNPDKEFPYIGITFVFSTNDGSNLIQKDSKYRWVQTVSTNENFNSNYDYNSGYGPNQNMQLLDISDRKAPSGGPISYSENRMILVDDLGRLTRDEYKVFWQAETSLIKVSDNNSV